MMQDLLSMNDEVLREVFQYSQPVTYYRLPLHVWLRLRDAMTGLIVMRSYNCWNWYHRQLSETLISRFSGEEKIEIHQTIGLYMSNIVPKEITEKGLISKQPLTLTPVQIWFHNAVINEQRFIEGFYHLVQGDLIAEAVKETTSFEVICGCALVNQGYELVQGILLLQSKIRIAAESQESLLVSSGFQDRVYHYYRWLYQDTSFISRSPRMIIPVSASNQPKISKVRQDIHEYIEKTRSNKEHCSFDKQSWVRGVTLGGYAEHTTELASLRGHSGGVKAVCISSDGSKVISGSEDNTVKIWDATTGACLNTLEGHNDYVSSVCISRDGSRIVSGSYNTVKIWDATTGACLDTLADHRNLVTSVCISSDGSRIVSGCKDNSIKIWDAATGACVNTLEGHSDCVTSVCISSDGSRIVSASFDKQIKIWDAATGSCVNTLEGHNDGVYSVCISSDGLRIVSGSDDYTIKIWDATTGACVNTLEGHDYRVSSVDISSDGSRIV